MKIRFRLSLLLLAVTGCLRAQILDDSTRQIYSQRTVFLRQEKEMLLDRGRIAPDTLLQGFSEKLDFLHREGIDYQNLGTFASASRPLLFSLPAGVGKRNGLDAYDALLPGREGVLYFRTLSPFTAIRYMQGARQRAMIQGTFAVNPLSGWNVAGHYQRLTALRVLNVTSQDERETDHHSLWASTNYRSPNGRLRFWAHYRHLNHQQYLTGGAKEGSGPGFSDSLFQFTNIMRARLFSDARNRDRRNDWHITQEFRFWKGVYFRSAFSREKQLYRYADSRPDSLYYGKENFFYQAEGLAGGEPDSLGLQRIFEVIDNSAGLGWRDSLLDVHLFLKRRNWSLDLAGFPGSKKGSDLIGGIYLDGSWKNIRIMARMEAINPDEYDLKGNVGWKGFSGAFRFFAYRPSLIQDVFQSKNLRYENAFRNTRAMHFKIDKLFMLNGIRIKPRFEWMQVTDGIAFDSTFRPFQAGGRSFFQYPGVDIETSLFRRLHSNTRFTRPIQYGRRIAGMPGYVISTSHWVDVVKNRKAYALQAGFSLDWRTDWTSEMFGAPNAQWYVQQQQSVPTYFMMNTFLNLRIDRVRVYFRVHNTLQGLGGKGYLAAPGYPAQRRLFEFGLDWTFFD